MRSQEDVAKVEGMDLGTTQLQHTVVSAFVAARMLLREHVEMQPLP